MAYFPKTLSTDQYRKHIQQFRDWCKAAHGRQQLIADRLKVSKQLVSGWLSGYRAISLDEWTQIQAVINKESAGAPFLEENKTMKTIVDPPKLSANARDHNNEPKTLHEAKEMIEGLRAQLKGAAVASPAKPAAFTVPAATAKPKLGSGADTPTITTPGAERLSPTPMPVNYPPPPKLTLSADLDSPVKNPSGA